jgi:glycyl-tRNA synthetase beta chain
MQQQSKTHNDFLIEILTEELPPKTLSRLATSLLTEIKTRLDKLELHYASAEWFATPRRLAVLIKKLAAKQQDTTIERKGPALEAAFDKEGKPTPACAGFAKSCGVIPEQLITIKTAQGTWVGYQQHLPGKKVQEILPEIITQALSALPIAKRMRWGESSAQFVRPVKSVVMLYGNDIIDAEILGCRTNRLTRGHRFHSKGEISISKPTSYVKALERKHVMVDFAKRKEIIRKNAHEVMLKQPELTVVIDENLLDEVTGLVEWPVAIMGRFDENFLNVPKEALMAAMQDHQRYFPVINNQKKLMPYFVTMSNIENKNMQSVIEGNERVLRARLADAAFFFATDKKIKLSARVKDLKNSIFQAKLGTLFDKSKRVEDLTHYIAKKIQLDEQQAKRAGLLSKADLTTQMVGEFPELQGVMGYYYAELDGEDAAVATALNEQYMPRFSGDALPETLLGCALAVADRIDTLVGIFGINQIPTGDKDPFKLRRAALGVLRILIEKKLNIDLLKLINHAVQQYNHLENKEVTRQVLDFIFDRLKPWYQDQNISPDVFASVAAVKISNPYDFHLRIQAVQHFKNLPEAEALSIANKRVSNILTKSNNEAHAHIIDEKLFEHHAERVLLTTLAEKRNAVAAFSANGNYKEVLTTLAGLREPVDDFFENVMVMAEDKSRRENRLLMLKELRNLFLQVADIALLQ